MNMTPEGQDRKPTISGNLRRINQETSSRLSAIARSDAPPPRTGRIRILALTCAAFVRTYVMKKNFTRGKEGFILSCEAAMEALVQAVKVWELAFRRAEGARRLPPSNEADVKNLSSRYATWTSS
jgi:hypothetical protein